MPCASSGHVLSRSIACFINKINSDNGVYNFCIESNEFCMVGIALRRLFDGVFMRIYPV